MNSFKWLMVWLWCIVLAIYCSHATASYIETRDSKGNIIGVIHKNVDLDSSVFQPLIDRLNQAKKGDTVHILVLNNQGGYVSTMKEIITAMRASDARVVVRVKGYAASAAAVISISGDVLELPHAAELLWHTGSICLQEDLCLVINPQIQLLGHRFEELYRTTVERDRPIYDPGYICIRPSSCMVNPFKSKTFVSKEHWEHYKTGGDMWIRGKEVCEHAKGWNKWTRYGERYCIIKGLK